MEVPAVAEGSINQSVQDIPLYVGITPHTLDRVVEEKDGKGKKMEKRKKGEKMGKENKKIGRKLEDGLLLVVPTRIHGKSVRALIDSGTTRCFITLACVASVGLKCTPRDTFPRIRKWRKILI